MGNIVAEASGTKISQTMQDTLSAVDKATKNLPEDPGATSDKVGKLMKLEAEQYCEHPGHYLLGRKKRL